MEAFKKTGGQKDALNVYLDKYYTPKCAPSVSKSMDKIPSWMNFGT